MADENVEKKPRPVAKAAPPTNATTEDVAQLRELTTSLIHAVGAMKAENEQRGVINGLVDDVRAATRSMRLGEVPAAHPVPIPGRTDVDCDCGCGPCDCVASTCCTYQIQVSHVRAIEMQLPLEPFDSNILPYAEMEIRMFVSIDGIGTVIPNLFSTLSLRKNIAKPGLWTQVNRSIGTVTVCKGGPTQFVVAVDAVEVDDGGVEALGIRDEYGSGAVTLSLDCCVSTPTTAFVEVHLDHNGLAGGAIELKLVATKICC